MNKYQIFGLILGMIIMFIIGALIFWGLGNLIIWVFKINYSWTILHGLICQFIYMLLKEIFGKK